MSKHRDLLVWQEAHAFRVRIHHLTDGARWRQTPRVVGQIRASSASIADNIAEGRASKSDPVYLRYLNIALASGGETDSQIAGLLDEHLISAEVAFDLTDELAIIRRMLLALHKSVKNRPTHR